MPQISYFQKCKTLCLSKTVVIVLKILLSGKTNYLENLSKSKGFHITIVLKYLKD